MGLGKTTTAIALCVISRWVRVATQAVEKSQAANDSKHLSPDNQGPPLGFVLEESLLADIDASLARHKQVELDAVHNAARDESDSMMADECRSDADVVLLSSEEYNTQPPARS